MHTGALIVLAVIYLAFHAGHSHARWRHAHRYPWWRRIWVSIPGPFGTRISRRL